MFVCNCSCPDRNRNCPAMGFHDRPTMFHIIDGMLRYEYECEEGHKIWELFRGMITCAERITVTIVHGTSTIINRYHPELDITMLFKDGTTAKVRVHSTYKKLPGIIVV